MTPENKSDLKSSIRKKRHEDKHRSNKKRKTKHNSNSTSSEEEWEERVPSESKASSGSNVDELGGRDEWMSLPTSFNSTSNLDRKRTRDESKKIQRELNRYDPSTNANELNPYWKDGGDGLPSTKAFKRPTDEEDLSYRRSFPRNSNWKKSKCPPRHEPHTSSFETNPNVLAAKLIKAEMMNDEKLVAELKRQLRSVKRNDVEEPEVILTNTNVMGQSRPLTLSGGAAQDGKRKRRNIETHRDGQRVRYFPDDDKHSLKQMFENEKYDVADDQKRFVELAGRVSKNDDLDDVFVDKIHREKSSKSVDEGKKCRAIAEHKRTAEALDNCRRCLQSENVVKDTMISLGETAYLSVPHYEPLTEGHCFVIPVRHVSCSTQLDENEWNEMLDFRRAVSRMFSSRGEDVVFFETAMNFHALPHMVLECVPLPKEHGGMAPMYFKKAIDESEMEWSTNKKLVPLSKGDVRKSIPKGLPYFWVSFGMDDGFAHVIEEQKYFPKNFASEIIGGMLDLDHGKWIRPKREDFDVQSSRVLKFSKMWSEFDCTH